jgi:hypothetical protein
MNMYEKAIPVAFKMYTLLNTFTQAVFAMYQYVPGN